MLPQVMAGSTIMIRPPDAEHPRGLAEKMHGKFNVVQYIDHDDVRNRTVGNGRCWASATQSSQSAN